MAAKSHFVKSARKNIWRRGFPITKIHKHGKNANKSYDTFDTARAHPDDDTLLIEKGESYYWWQFAFGSKRLSKTTPKQSQLTQSSFLSGIYGLEESISGMNWTMENFTDQLNEIKDQLQEMQDECEDNLSNIPEQLQDGAAGNTLTERIDNLTTWISDIENIEAPENEDEVENKVAELTDSNPGF